MAKTQTDRVIIFTLYIASNRAFTKLLTPRQRWRLRCQCQRIVKAAINDAAELSDHDIGGRDTMAILGHVTRDTRAGKVVRE